MSSARRILAVTRRTLSQFRHDRRTLGFVVVMPLLMVVVFGYTFGGAVHDVRTLVVNQDQGFTIVPLNRTFHIADAILENIEGDTLALETWTDPAAARAEVVAGRAWAVLVFPANFSEDAMNGTAPAAIGVVLDGSSPSITAALFGTLRAAIEGALQEIVGAVSSPLTIEPDFVYGSEDTRFIDAFAPGVVALAVLMVTTILSVIMIVREKAGSMLERLFSTPLRSHEFVVGVALALAVIAFLQSTVVLGAALLLFQVKVVGNLALAFAVLLLFAVGNQGLGIMLSAAAKNELQAIQFVPLILFPSLLLTGVFFPLEAIPGGLRPLSYAVPLTYAADALHSIMLRGWGIGDLGVALDVFALVIYDVLTLLGAAVFVRRQA